MSALRRYVRYLISSPKLYRIYNPALQSVPPAQQQSPYQYSPRLLETLSDAAITYILPITLILTVYNRKLSYLQFTVLLYLASRVVRSLSRLTNPEYITFLTHLDKAVEAGTSESLETLRQYDFEFKYFPVIHSCVVSVSEYVDRRVRQSGMIMYYLSWAMAHSFGIRLIYPGLILGGVLRSVLEEGRAKLVVEKRGVRVKINVQSETHRVEVDSMFFDRRGTSRGNVLFICCEGNAGFYEIGMLGGALAEGYSILGWNHPGFGGSTGVPYPTAELTAALGVIDYATNVLGFKENSIVLYGWSIGGFPATYLASRYPNIKGLLLDATFDDILPLAIPRMPECMSSLVVATIRNHVNLNNTENMSGYSGPIRLVRRTDDEIIADPPGVLNANRGNNLLVHVISSRYPQLATPRCITALNEWLNRAHDTEVTQYDSLAGNSVAVPERFENEDEAVKVVIKVASGMLRDYKSTHCTPLPREFYRISSLSLAS